MSHNGTVPNELNGGQVTAESAGTPDPEVVAKAERRKFTAEYKLRVLAEADSCTKPGQIGALLRREGLYRSHLDKWRKQRREGTLQALSPQKRGPKADPQAAEIARLRRENERLQERLRRAENIIEVQKKSPRYLAHRWTRARATSSADRDERRTGPDGRHDRGVPGVGRTAQHVVPGT